LLPWSDLGVVEVRLACAQGHLIVRGPLNDAYRVTLRGQLVFVRHRTVRDAEYGQTFAAEQYVYELLDSRVRIPRLLALVADQGEPAYAVFDFVSTQLTDWTSMRALAELAHTLAAIHEVRGEKLGYVGQEGLEVDAADYLRQLYADELSRTEPQVQRAIGSDYLTNWLCAVRDLFEDEPIVLCHGDVYQPNVLTDLAGNLWLIDWEAARYRVAASDFNQMRHGWLTYSQEQAVMREYVRLTGVDLDRLSGQVVSLRVLWHVRTLNFYMRVHSQSIQQQWPHIAAARCLLEAGWP
jgi:aminoglycoside phosphotransferase (APT) family kinase protein